MEELIFGAVTYGQAFAFCIGTIITLLVVIYRQSQTVSVKLREKALLNTEQLRQLSLTLMKMRNKRRISLEMHGLYKWVIDETCVITYKESDPHSLKINGNPASLGEVYEAIYNEK